MNEISVAEWLRRFVELPANHHCLTADQLENMQQRLGVALPADFVDLLTFADGFDLFGLTIMSMAEGRLFENGLYPFHNWGNGNFDCVRLTPPDHGSIYFMNHGPDVTVRISDSLISWLTGMQREFESYGNVWHPMDYRRGRRPAGVYAHVLTALQGVDCELNGG